jgi:hypothetical protein
MLKTEKSLRKIISTMLNEVKRTKDEFGKYIDDPDNDVKTGKRRKDDTGKYIEPRPKKALPGLPKTRRTLISPDAPLKDATRVAGMIIRTGSDDKMGKKIRKGDLLQTEKDLYDF